MLFPDPEEWVNDGDAVVYKPFGDAVAGPMHREKGLLWAEIAGHIEAALREAATAGISGKAVTPFLLDAIHRSTGGRSLTTNIALVKNNARLAAEIAVALAKT
jgi:pseudouridine-5'-phosphate glycosidase